MAGSRRAHGRARKAIELLGQMQGGYNVAPLVGALDAAADVATAAAQAGDIPSGRIRLLSGSCRLFVSQIRWSACRRGVRTEAQSCVSRPMTMLHCMLSFGLAQHTSSMHTILCNLCGSPRPSFAKPTDTKPRWAARTWRAVRQALKGILLMFDAYYDVEDQRPTRVVVAASGGWAR